MLTIAIAAVEVAVAELFSQFLTTRVALVFLTGILVTGLRLGSRAAFAGAVLATAGYAYYLAAPHGSLAFHAPGDLVTLGFFLAVGLATGALAGRTRDERQQTAERARTAAALYLASRELSAMAAESDLRSALAGRIGEAAGGVAVVYADGSAWGAYGAVAPMASVLADATAALHRAGGGSTVSAGDWSARRLLAGGFDLGIALWRGAASAGTPREGQLISVLVDLGAAAIARSRLAAANAEVEGLARAHQLLASLLASISHDFRTPLSAILASASSLRTYGDVFGVATRDDLLITIEEEAERLNRFVANLLNMTKLESGVLTCNAQAIDLGELVHAVGVRAGRRTDRDVTISIDAPAGILVQADPVLLDLALTNVVDNAVRFSPASGCVEIAVTRGRGLGSVIICDRGPGVPDRELDRIFDRFYRSPAATKFGSGTGLGLSISRGLAEAMGGTIAASNRQGLDEGLCMRINLPEPTP